MQFALSLSLLAGLASAAAILPRETKSFAMGTAVPTKLMSKDGFTSLSARGLETRATAAEYYECDNSNPEPVASDCASIISGVAALNEELIVTAGSCLTFSYGTCGAFFCSLCEEMTTNTTTVSSELSEVDDLCVAGGQVGTIIDDSAPQFEVGFTYTGAAIPTYDVC
ncbi:hypothetical protein GGR56DRAFT_33059 [Xylariaceae sp. FL0804]|nr:hypothetical protein GGR56DRAFT_33059 [Xylariaceae sp. FL0804]